MNFKEKRHAKKMAKIFITLAYAMVIAFVVTIIVGIIIYINSDEPKMSGTLMLVIVFTVIILGLVLGSIGQHFIDKRMYYMQAIGEYRQCTFFTKCIQLLMTGDKDSIDLTINTYNLINENTSRRKFIYAFIIASSYYSKDKKKVEKGRKHLDNLLDSYNPEKVSFKK